VRGGKYLPSLPGQARADHRDRAVAVPRLRRVDRFTAGPGRNWDPQGDPRRGGARGSHLLSRDRSPDGRPALRPPPPGRTAPPVHCHQHRSHESGKGAERLPQGRAAPRATTGFGITTTLGARPVGGLLWSGLFRGAPGRRRPLWKRQGVRAPDRGMPFRRPECRSAGR